jgi:hypothetical protein
MRETSLRVSMMLVPSHCRPSRSSACRATARVTSANKDVDQGLFLVSDAFAFAIHVYNKILSCCIAEMC